MFSRIAIVNRGEAAMRLIHAVRDLNAEAGPGGHRIETVALHTSGERRAMFVREADLAYDLGPASNRPYLDYGVLERALIETQADAAWVGWGFVAEDPNFAELCSRLGVRFIGPSATAMRKLGDKIGSKLIAEEVGVPVAPWSGGGVADLAAATAAAAKIGYPLMLKATAGGGGRGIRMVSSDAELADAYQRTRDEAQRAFGSGVVFLEQLVTGARHVEVQVIADGQGTAWAIGVRDCSVQRRNQKVIEESSSPVLGPEQAAELKAAAERLAIAVGYAGAGTVEFLYRPTDQLFAFLEVNTRLQVEHPITEITTDTDLVRMQIQIAAGQRLTGRRPIEKGHAVEARLNAEDPDRDFAPSPGRIALLELPAGPGIRVDTGVGEGDSIPADFDSMIAKIIAYGKDRAQALARLRRAMQETTVVIEGGATNKSFVLELLDAPEVTGEYPNPIRSSVRSTEPDPAGSGKAGPGKPSPAGGWADTGWIDRTRAAGGLVANRHSGVALVAAGIATYESEEAVERTRLLETAHGGRPQVQHQVGRPVDLKLRGQAYRVTVYRSGPQRYWVIVADATTEYAVVAELDRLDTYKSRLKIAGRTYRLVTATHGPTQLVEVDGVTHRISLDEGGVLRSPAPALVVATPVAIGAEVSAGAPVLVLESMKMETVLAAPFAAKVKELLVSAGSQVETGSPLIRLEPVDDDPAAELQPAHSSAGVDLELPLYRPDRQAQLAAGDSAKSDDPATRAATELRDLFAVLLGYDLDPADNGQTLARYLANRDQLVTAGESPLAGELALLEAFADFTDLARTRSASVDRKRENQVHSPREHFHTYLRSLDPDRGALPEDFRDKLLRVLRHYGVTSLDRTPELERAVFRIFLAQQRWQPDVQVVTSLLQRWIADPAPPTEAEPVFRDVLDRAAGAAQQRFPVVAELARSARFRWYDQPLVDLERQAVLDAVGPDLVALTGMPPGPEREAGLDQLAVIPEPIVSFLAARLDGGAIPADEPMLAILVKRHYREYQLRDLKEFNLGGRPYAVADYTTDRRPTHLVTTVGRFDELRAGSDLVTSLAAQIAAAPPGHRSVVDLYLSWPDVPADADDASAHIADRLAGLGLMHAGTRFTVATSAGAGQPVGYFIFRPEPGAPDPDRILIEDTLVRGVHPMVGRRLTLGRLREFDVTRLDAPEDVLLYRCVAPGNESDVRLVALAQVRQLVVVRDESGRVISLPHAERAISNCREAIRRVRAAAGSAGHRLDMNYVWVYIWPTISADPRELTALQSHIAPMTSGAGIEELLVGGNVKMPDGTVQMLVAGFRYQPGSGVVTTLGAPTLDRLRPLDDYTQKVVRARRRGVVYPYELVSLIAGRGGSATELELDGTGRLVPAVRPYGQNRAGIIAGLISTPTKQHPEGIQRVLLCGDPLRSLGAVAEPECARIIAALDLAEEMGVPVEWFALSAGARISMESGTENMDWVARALKRIVEFTQAGGEINVVVAGINVGAQPYWNAEATMLMHTKGVLIMTPDSAMVLTGKQSLDFSGGVSAEDNFGIGGYDRVMGPNGQAQYWAPDLAGARTILMSHYDHTYVVPGETRPRRAPTTDPHDRDVTSYPHDPEGSGFSTVGDIFSPAKNPDRKKAFDIRTVMAAVADQDHATQERWAGMADAETSVVWDAHLGGLPVAMIGIESRSVPRRGFPPTDGPDVYTAGTLFPRSSKKTARAINTASGNRPLVVIANLSGFDGSPESMRQLQLEYGAEIGRAIVNFDGPIVFCVVSRYHGGAFVVFSKALNPQMTVLAVAGSFASVIGGAPAAAVVFSREVDARTAKDPRVTALEQRLAATTDSERAALATELAEVRRDVRAEKLGEVAAEFDRVHNIHRAVEVGSVDAVIAASELRPAIIAALEHGLSQPQPKAIPA